MTPCSLLCIVTVMRLPRLLSQTFKRRLGIQVGYQSFKMSQVSYINLCTKCGRLRAGWKHSLEVKFSVAPRKKIDICQCYRIDTLVVHG